MSAALQNYQEKGLLALLQEFWQEMTNALAAMPRWERNLHIFWLLGPFILLIERSPADLWLSIIALSFVVRAIVMRDGHFLSVFWVKAAFAFWVVTIIAGALSPFPAIATGEAVAWFRFPLFAMATVFWFAREKRLRYAMLL